MSEMKQFIYMIRAVRPGFADASTPEEDAVMSEHFAHLKAKFDAGELLLAGPCTDAAFGIIVFEAESEQAAMDFMNNDPSVRKHVMNAELHPFRASLMKSI